MYPRFIVMFPCEIIESDDNLDNGRTLYLFDDMNDLKGNLTSDKRLSVQRNAKVHFMESSLVAVSFLV